jgi:hypothetical protein
VKISVDAYIEILRSQPDDLWGKDDLYDESNGHSCKLGWALLQCGVSWKELADSNYEYQYSHTAPILNKEKFGFTQEECDDMVEINDMAHSSAQATRYIERYLCGEDEHTLIKEIRQEDWDD